MNPSIQQQVTETLELCLSKMSEKLQSNFDPEDKDSIKLLQQFRSTLNTMRSWIKVAQQKINETANTVKETFKKSFGKSAKNQMDDIINKIVDQFPYNPEAKRMQEKINQPSGLKYTPAHGV